MITVNSRLKAGSDFEIEQMHENRFFSLKSDNVRKTRIF